MQDDRSLVFGAVLNSEAVTVRAIPHPDQITFLVSGQRVEVQIGEFADFVLKALVMAHSTGKAQPGL